MTRWSEKGLFLSSSDKRESIALGQPPSSQNPGLAISLRLMTDRWNKLVIQKKLGGAGEHHPYHCLYGGAGSWNHHQTASLYCVNIFSPPAHCRHEDTEESANDSRYNTLPPSTVKLQWKCSKASQTSASVYTGDCRRILYSHSDTVQFWFG